MEITPEIRKQLTKENYEIVGKHSAVKICNWTKNSLRDEGVCYKEQFYGIKSHLCCQMSCTLLNCQNKCIHCWRDLRYSCPSEVIDCDDPKKIIDESIIAQRKLLTGFKIDPNSDKKQLSKANQEKLAEAQEPMQFAISLTGEGLLYPKVGELIEELTRRGKTSFLVSNGLCPERLQEIVDKNQLPTQLYISVNSPNKKLYDEFHRSSKKNAWEKLNESLAIMSTLKGQARTVFRMNLIRDLNMENEHVEEYAKMIKKTNPMIVEIKGFMSVGHARKRLGYDRMPNFEEMQKFIEKLSEATGLKILDSHERSRAWVLGENKEELRIKGL